MVTTSRSLFQLTAADLMSPVVITVPRQMSLKGAAHLLAQNRISGAPVVDDDGHCIGVVSATDFVFLAGGDKKPISQAAARPCFCSDWAVLNGGPATESGMTVECVMTGNPVTAHRSMSIGELAREMLDAHIHRVVIVDDFKHPIGVVTSTDLIAAVAQMAPPAGTMSPEVMLAGVM